MTWLQLPGDPREHYIARLQWADAGTRAASSSSIACRTPTRYLLADAAVRTRRARCGAITTRRSSRIGFGGLPEARPIRGGTRVPRDCRRRTAGCTSIASRATAGRRSSRAAAWTPSRSPASTRRAAGCISSPRRENATQRYLYRAPLDGTRRSGPGHARARSPARTPTTSRRTAGSPFHAFSSFDDPGHARAGRAARAHAVVRAIGDSADAEAEARARCSTPPVEFFKADAGGGVMVDGYLIKPPDFDPSKKYPVLVHIYGEPAGQTVDDSWGGAGDALSPLPRQPRLPGRQLRQCRHARAARPRLAQGDLRIGRRAVVDAAGARRCARWPRRGRSSISIASRCGAGAAAARTRST